MRGQVRIDSLFAFVVVDDDGSEGVPAFPGPGGVLMPMMGADLARMDLLEPMAQLLATTLNKQVTLCRFLTRDELKVIDP